jgi:hypothetical protein
MSESKVEKVANGYIVYEGDTQHVFTTVEGMSNYLRDQIGKRAEALGHNVILCIEIDDGKDATPAKSNAGAVALLEQWLADNSGYDETVWPVLQKALDELKGKDATPADPASDKSVTEDERVARERSAQMRAIGEDMACKAMEAFQRVVDRVFVAVKVSSDTPTWAMPDTLDAARGPDAPEIPDDFHWYINEIEMLRKRIAELERELEAEQRQVEKADQLNYELIAKIETLEETETMPDKPEYTLADTAEVLDERWAARHRAMAERNAELEARIAELEPQAELGKAVSAFLVGETLERSGTEEWRYVHYPIHYRSKIYYASTPLAAIQAAREKAEGEDK